METSSGGVGLGWVGVVQCDEFILFIAGYELT